MIAITLRCGSQTASREHGAGAGGGSVEMIVSG